MQPITTALGGLLALGLASCGNFEGTSGAYDPLEGPAGGAGIPTVQPRLFTAGQFVRTVIEGAAFYQAAPGEATEADKLLPLGTSMKVISRKDGIVKVELDSGEVGFVPAVMLEDASTPAAPPVNPNEVQVFPPANGAIPTTPPAEQPPGGAIPTVIDPNAPVPAPPSAPSAPSAPAGPPPLPPNQDELRLNNR